MNRSQIGFGVVVLIAVMAGGVTAQSITATDLDGLALGAKIVGPVGPEVETSLINPAGESLGDLSSSVSCPDGFAQCTPPSNPAGTIYTYVHTVTPGVDLPNDGPFLPNPDVVIAFDDVTEFGLGFEAVGFNGVAGYRFSDAAAALGGADAFDIEQLGDGSLLWTLSTNDWDVGESISFFWQTTQPPSGPGGVYSISDGLATGSGAGPLPTAVPEPGTAAMLGLFLGLGRVRRRAA